MGKPQTTRITPTAAQTKVWEMRIRYGFIFGGLGWYRYLVHLRNWFLASLGIPWHPGILEKHICSITKTSE